ncbi:MAG: hypothetical protein HGA45_44180, partial [Chloroflexales bacterium]|nr:hypothetical protein [Chloroflexales bacterium]
MSEPQTDLFGNEVAAATPTPAPQPRAPAPTPGKTKLVFGQKAVPAPAARAIPPARPTTLPPKPGAATRSSLPPPLMAPQLVRPVHEHRVDEAQATALIFDRLLRAAQRVLFELQQANPAYVPRLPSAAQVALASEQLMSDPQVRVRIALLAGSFREPPPPPAIIGMPVAPVTAPPEAAEEPAEAPAAPESTEEEVEAAAMAPGAPEATQDGPKPEEAGEAAPLTVVAKIGRLIEYIVGRKWGPAEALARHFPDAIHDHWARVLVQARTANDVMSIITHANLNRALGLAEVIDCQPVREDLEVRIAERRAGLPPLDPPVKPTRMART